MKKDLYIEPFFMQACGGIPTDAGGVGFMATASGPLETRIRASEAAAFASFDAMMKGLGIGPEIIFVFWFPYERLR